MKIQFFLLAILATLTGCTSYRGDGEFSKLTRTYIPVIGVNRGYLIEMPAFTPVKDQSFSYSLTGMPRQNDFFTVEMIIYQITEPMSPAEQQVLDVSVPDAHMIRSSLRDKRSGKVITENTSKVNDLPITNSLDFGKSPCIRTLLRVNYADVPQDANLELRVNYNINGMPLKREMMIMVVNEPPFA